MIKRRKKEEIDTDNLLEIKKVYHYYDKAKALEEINLSLEAKKLEAVIGPNGAGKTTLLRVISGLEEIDRGKIFFKGKRIDELDEYKIAQMGISHCPERRKLFPDMSVLENLEMGAFTVKDKKKVKELLNYVFSTFPRLKERKKQRAATLSGGEQQMLALGRAMMGNPTLLLLDEPSLGLAPRPKKKIFEAISQFQKSGTTTLLVEQDAVLAMRTADYIHVLEEGKIEMRGTKKQLEKEPRIKEVYLGI
jgi:branched-chain amino acid transport system ATP-binding protein